LFASVGNGIQNFIDEVPIDTAITTQLSALCPIRVEKQQQPTKKQKKKVAEQQDTK
jgi:hypothetical protein